MKRTFKKMPVKASTQHSQGGRRVVAIQLDVCIPESLNSDDVIAVAESAINRKLENTTVVGSEYVEDLTELYQRDYPELLD